MISAFSCKNHKLIFEIAKQLVETDVFNTFNELMNEFPDDYPKHLGYKDAACWADAIKYSSNYTYRNLYKAKYHYIDLPFYKDPIMNTYDYERNITTEINQYFDTIQHHYGRVTSKQQFIGSLRFYLHVASDLHCPLHVFQLIDDMHPKGDKGGTKTFCSFSNRPLSYKKSLHYVFDNAGYISSKHPTEEKYISYILSLCNFFDINKSTGMNLYNVVLDTLKYTDEVYTKSVLPKCALSNIDLQYIQYVSDTQICKAGYFVANYINNNYAIFKDLLVQFREKTDDEIQEFFDTYDVFIDKKLHTTIEENE